MDDAQHLKEEQARSDAQASEEHVEDELTKAKQEAAANLEGWQRATADYANLKRESEKMRAEAGGYAVGSFVEKLLPVVEGFRQATAQPPVSPDQPFDEKRVSQWVEGVGHVRDQLDKVLAGAGVTTIAEENVPFDPSMHDAMLSEKREGVEPGQVVKVLEAGAKLGERVLKPARVVVSE